MTDNTVETSIALLNQGMNEIKNSMVKMEAKIDLGNQQNVKISSDIAVLNNKADNQKAYQDDCIADKKLLWAEVDKIKIKVYSISAGISVIIAFGNHFIDLIKK